MLNFLRALLGANDIHGPTRKHLTALDICERDGVFHIGEYQSTPEEAYNIALEILRRLPKR